MGTGDCELQSLGLWLVWYGLSIMYGYSSAPRAPFHRQAASKATFVLMTSLSDHPLMETERRPIVFRNMINLDIPNYFVFHDHVLRF